MDTETSNITNDLSKFVTVYLSKNYNTHSQYNISNISTAGRGHITAKVNGIEFDIMIIPK